MRRKFGSSGERVAFHFKELGEEDKTDLETCIS